MSDRATVISKQKTAAFNKVVEECNGDLVKARKLAETNNIKPYEAIDEKKQLQNIKFHKFDEEQGYFSCPVKTKN